MYALALKKSTTLSSYRAGAAVVLRLPSETVPTHTRAFTSASFLLSKATPMAPNALGKRTERSNSQENVLRHPSTKRTERSNSQENVLRHPSTKRAKEIDSHPPYAELRSFMSKQRSAPKARNVLHWFRSKDIRAEDNRALHFAAAKAKEVKGALLAVYLFSPKDLEWHGTSPARTDFILENLRLLKEQLGKLNIPLVPLISEKRSTKTRRVLEFVKEHDIGHIFANIEYEIDELRRDIDMFKKIEDDESGIAFELYDDQTVITPGELVTGSGTPHKVFTPYHRNWLSEVGAHPDLLETMDIPTANDKSAREKYRDLFLSGIPEKPEGKHFESEEERDRLRGLWPAGHAAAVDRLDHFLEEKIKTYKQNRSNPAADNSSRLSPYFSSGILSVREALSAARKANGNKNFDKGDPGIDSWVREIVFREFYRHVLVNSPHDAMNLPHNLKFDFVRFEDDYEGEKKWYEGMTGVPFVDAGMRQLNSEAYMHNRLRMNTSSYLRTNLLIDYRKGERYFAEHLIDWDLSNNTQGWEPSYTVFNPVVQAEKCDPHGDFIRKYVPELRDVKGKAIFDPYNRLSKAEFAKLGYPKPHVDYTKSKQRCIERYKSGMADADP
jgi:deoxyribodipyrimidine photo-lyase